MAKLHTVEVDGRDYFCGYRVVTEDLRSLGLRRNPNILQYQIKEWYFLPEDWIVEGDGDFGGIWVCKNRSGASAIQKYMMEKYSRNTRLFSAAIDKVVFENTDRAKTNGIMLLEEIAR
jgi:hypothetical protein